jgi:UDP-3-O-[3-hydroxymyristoyl] glucosamine N-acyltransferase
VEQAGAGEVTLALDQKRFEQALGGSASAILVPEELQEVSCDRPLLVSSNPKLAYARLLGLFGEPSWRPEGISELAFISDQAELSEGVAVGPGAFVGPGTRVGPGSAIYPGVYLGADVQVGRNCTLLPGVVVLDRCELGDQVLLHPGVVIGADGFGTVWDGDRHRKIPQIGNVLVGDDVEIGANSCIDRATTGSTRIGANSKIDNLVQVGHNVIIEDQVLISGKVGISGSARIGARAVLAGESAVVDHATVGEGAILMARAVATVDVPAGGQVLGFPARPHREELRIQAVRHRLPSLLKELRDLKERVRRLEGSRDGGE